MPPVNPNEWNIGIALKTRSAPLKSTTLESCAQLVTMLRWLSATPLGMPSDPLVKSTTATESGDAFAPGQPAREMRVPRSSQLGVKPERRAQVLGPQDADLLLETLDDLAELRLLDESSARDDRRGLRCGAGDEHRIRAGREIEHRRHASEGLKRHERHDRAVCVRQEHADAFARFRLRREPAPEDAGAEHARGCS